MKPHLLLAKVNIYIYIRERNTPTRDPHLKANRTNGVLAKNVLFRVLFKLFSMKRVFFKEFHSSEEASS